MDLFRPVPAARWRCLFLVTAVALVLVGVAQPVSAMDCSECDSGCYINNDPYALLQEYEEDKNAFAARSSRCSSSDPKWTEISENINRADPPNPPTDQSNSNSRRRRKLTEFERLMTMTHLRISGCMLLCGKEEFQEDCIAGMGGKSCNCKPGALPYCRAQAQDSAREIIAPNHDASDALNEEAPVAGGTHSDVEDPGEIEPEPESAEEARYMIEVGVSADGFEPSTVYAPCDYEPSSVTVSGVVLDDTRTPVRGARVTLAGLGAVDSTDSDGAYSLTVPTEGDTPFMARRDFVITRLVQDLHATLAPVSTVWANGREVEAVLTVTAEGLPLAGKEITLTDWKGFSHQGRQVDYVIPRRGNNIPLRLDDAGQARFRFEAPIVPSERGATIADPDSAFPVEGHFRVMVRGQDAETECDYSVASPFPRIGQIRVPGNVDAGLWQVSPSSIVIDDPDSSRFRVTVRGLGDFRTTQPGAATKKGVLSHELKGKQFEFLYRPPKGGLDPTAMPDVLDQFMNTSKNIYIGVATNVVGGMLIDKVQVLIPGDGLAKGLSKMGLNLDAGKLLDAGGNMANVINLGSGTYLDLTTVSEDPNNAQKKIVAGGNYIIGVVDTSMGFAGTLGTVQQKLAWEAAKAYWEYVKLMNSLTNQYQDLANAYQGTRFFPISVTVEDESGHRTTASRACSVREWAEGSK